MYKLYGYGFIAGLLNGIFGTGGGILIVPMLKNNGLNSQKSTCYCYFNNFTIKYYYNCYVFIKRNIFRIFFTTTNNKFRVNWSSMWGYFIE